MLERLPSASPPLSAPEPAGLKAVWSLWTKPYAYRRGTGWASEKHHALAWVLSFELARKHYPETCLITDDDGARLLVDKLRLGFDHVSTSLNALKDQDPGWWALGKLYAYRAQDSPFVHLDTDAFLWKRLPEKLERAGVFAQSPDPFRAGASYYRPEIFERALRVPAEGWLPEEWVWFRRAQRNLRGDCCGIFGGTRIDFIRYYADLALRLVNEPANREGWARLTDKTGNVILLEQFLLAACIEYHNAHQSSPFGDVRIAYLFNSSADIFDPDCTTRAGYTHLLGDSKRNAVLAARMETRVRQDYPEQYERCLSLYQS